MARKLIDQLFSTSEENPPSHQRVWVSLPSWKAVISRLNQLELQVKANQQHTKKLDSLIRKWLKEDNARILNRENALSPTKKPQLMGKESPDQNPNKHPTPAEGLEGLDQFTWDKENSYQRPNRATLENMAKEPRWDDTPFEKKDLLFLQSQLKKWQKERQLIKKALYENEQKRNQLLTLIKASEPLLEDSDFLEAEEAENVQKIKPRLF